MSEITDAQIWEWLESQACCNNLRFKLWSEACNVQQIKQWYLVITDEQSVEHEYTAETFREAALAAMNDESL